MPIGSINLTLRPIKFAFLVDPNVSESILKAIQINTFLWGGIYNPIIPVFKKTPNTFYSSKSEKRKYSDVINGYIDTFDPDYIGKVGNIDVTNINVGFRKVISCEEVLGDNPESKFISNYGVGIFEIVKQYFKDDLKYVHHFPMNFVNLNFNGKCNLFLKSVFGCLDTKIHEKFLEYYTEGLKIETKNCKIDSFGEFLKEKYIFYRRLTQRYIKFARTRGAWKSDCIFIMDAENNLDIIDYWNLRAIGWQIIPFPTQSIGDQPLMENILNFIEENYYPTQEYPQVIYNHTTLLKSRSLDVENFKIGLKQIDFKSINSGGNLKVSTQNWYPRMWDKWAREKDFVEFCSVESKSKSIDLSGYVDKISFNIIKPKFVKRYHQLEPQFVNELEIRNYSDGEELYAQIIPECDRNLIRALSAYGYDEWRFSRNGINYLSKHNEKNIRITLPKANEVFLEWLRSKNFNPIISDNGRSVNQIIKYIRGTQNITKIATESIIKLLIEMKEGRTKTNKELYQFLSIYSMEERYEIIASLSKLKILQCGLEIKCPICAQSSWYSLSKLDYSLNCQKCFNNFQFYIVAQTDLILSYKTLGPFSFSKSNYGVLSELLTLRFFSNVMHNPSTIISGINLTEDIEFDLGVLYQSSYIGDKKIMSLFCECKTNNEFLKIDMDRAQKISSCFPGAILVFATLNKKLSDSEKKLFLSFVKRERNKKKQKKAFSQILILTGVELFANEEPPYCWKDLEGIYKNYHSGGRSVHDINGLCEATQEIYIGISPLDKKWVFSSEKGMIETS